jgi:hypothetical protein
MEVGGVVLTLAVTREHETSSFAQLMEVANDAGMMAVTSRQLVGRPCAPHTEVVEGAMSKDATSQPNRLPDFVSSTAVAKSAHRMDAKRLLVGEPNTVLHMAGVSDANSRAATASLLGSCSSVELMVAVQE